MGVIWSASPVTSIEKDLCLISGSAKAGELYGGGSFFLYFRFPILEKCAVLITSKKYQQKLWNAPDPSLVEGFGGGLRVFVRLKCNSFALLES